VPGGESITCWIYLSGGGKRNIKGIYMESCNKEIKTVPIPAHANYFYITETGAPYGFSYHTGIKKLKYILHLPKKIPTGILVKPKVFYINLQKDFVMWKVLQIDWDSNKMTIKLCNSKEEVEQDAKNMYQQGQSYTEFEKDVMLQVAMLNNQILNGDTSAKKWYTG